MVERGTAAPRARSEKRPAPLRQGREAGRARGDHLPHLPQSPPVEGGSTGAGAGTAGPGRCQVQFPAPDRYPLLPVLRVPRARRTVPLLVFSQPVVASRAAAVPLIGAFHSFRNFRISSKNSKRFFSNSTKW